MPAMYPNLLSVVINTMTNGGMIHLAYYTMYNFLISAASYSPSLREVRTGTQSRAEAGTMEESYLLMCSL